MQPQASYNENRFLPINTGFNRTFRPNRLSLGLVVPIENYESSAVPTMHQHLERVQLAEKLGFAAVWLRDVPFNVPSFYDVGQIFDPFVYLGFLAGQTRTITLGVASIVLPLRHPAHVAKSAASVDALSGGRLILGIASGDRPEEYPALNQTFDDRGYRFRESYDYIRKMSQNSPTFKNHYGRPDGSMDMLPKPTSGTLPLLITGASQQDPNWVATNGDGWLTYPRKVEVQQKIITGWRQRIKDQGMPNKPAVQALHIDLLEDPNAPAEPIRLGFRSGINALRSHLKELELIGINHVALNVRANQADMPSTLARLADGLFPEFGE